MKRLLLVLLVGVLALAAGAAVAGRPTSVPNDVVIDQPPATTGQAGTIDPSTTMTTGATTSNSTTTSAAPDLSVDTRQPRSRPTDATSSTEPAGANPSTTLVPESGLRVAVANATNFPGIATEHVAILNGLGYVDATPTDATDTADATAVFFSDGFSSEALRLAQQLGLDENAVQPHPEGELTSDDVETDLWLIVGADRVP